MRLIYLILMSQRYSDVMGTIGRLSIASVSTCLAGAKIGSLPIVPITYEYQNEINPAHVRDGLTHWVSCHGGDQSYSVDIPEHF